MTCRLWSVPAVVSPYRGKDWITLVTESHQIGSGWLDVWGSWNTAGSTWLQSFGYIKCLHQNSRIFSSIWNNRRTTQRQNDLCVINLWTLPASGERGRDCRSESSHPDSSAVPPAEIRELRFPVCPLQHEAPPSLPWNHEAQIVCLVCVRVFVCVCVGVCLSFMDERSCERACRPSIHTHTDTHTHALSRLPIQVQKRATSLLGWGNFLFSDGTVYQP